MNLESTYAWWPWGGEAGSRIIVGKVIQIGLHMDGKELARHHYEKYI
jgi:hypothetical protein